MKLSFRIILPIVLISALLILLAGCFGVPSDESPGYTPGTITGIIAAPCCSTSDGPVTEPCCVYPEYWYWCSGCLGCEGNWSLQNNIKVVLTYGLVEVATTTTNNVGEYTFTNVPPAKNYVITAYCPDYTDDRPLVKDVALKVVEGKTYDAKITDCVSTALGLVVDYLVENTTVLGPEEIVLDGVIAGIPNFYGFPDFKKLVDRICEISPECVNLFEDEWVPEYLCLAAEEVGQIVLPDLVLECGPGYTPPNPPPGACEGNVAPIIDSVSIDGTPVAINDVIDVVLGNSYEITVTAHDPDNKLGTLTYYASANGVESAATTSNQITITPVLPGTFTVYVYVNDGCISTSWGPVTVKVDCCPLAEPGVTIDISKKTRGTSLSLCLDECATINSVTVNYTDGTPPLIITNLNDTSLAWSYDDTKISFNKTTGEVCLVGGLSGTAGKYTISVTYTDPYGETANGSVDLTFIDCSCQPPTAEAGGPYSDKVCPGANSTISFNGTASGTGTLTYAWDFGDGGTSNLEDPSHTYINPFTGSPYTVTLTVFDDCGNTTDTTTVTITECINHKPELVEPLRQAISAVSYLGSCIPTYKYTVVATDSDSDNLKFYLMANSYGNIPSGMVIDEDTGVITGWTPECCDGATRCHLCCTECVKVKVVDDGCCQPLFDEMEFCIEVWNGWINNAGNYVGIGFDGCPINKDDCTQ